MEEVKPEDKSPAYNNSIDIYSKTIASDNFAATKASSITSYVDIDGKNTSMRSPFAQGDYDSARPEDAMPRTHEEIVRACESAYQEIGLIRNMIDLMADFVVQGIRLIHPSPRHQEFYDHWFERICGSERSERFSNNLYRVGTAIVRRRTARLTVADRKKIQRSIADIAAAGDTVKVEHVKGKKNVVPYEYTFLNPCTVKLVGGCAATFAKKSVYAIEIPRTLNPINMTEAEQNKFKELIADLPSDIKKAIQSNDPILLNEDNTIVYNYKKDDWQQWSYPIIYSILYDTIVLRKMKLADMSALDGAIDNFRIFKLGNLEHKIMPGEGAFNKLHDALQANVAAGIKDIVWGPDIEVIETKNNTYQFLGDDKYKPHLNAIYSGLGIPPTLTGTDKASGTTNNLVSLKTLIQRLKYGRNQLVKFWNGELELVRQAMGHRKAAIVSFENMNLGDEEAEKKLWIELAERNIISDQALRDRFGINSETEVVKIRTESELKEKDKLPKKASPFHDPQLNEREAVKVATSPSSPTSPDSPGNSPGRPENSRDTAPRKRREIKPVTNAAIRLWAEESQEKIYEILKPHILSIFSKKNMRSLSAREHEISEEICFGVLLNTEPRSKITDKMIMLSINTPVNNKIINEYKLLASSVQQDLSKNLTTNELRKIQIEVYLQCQK